MQKLLHTLADANRLRIIHAIGEEQRAVSEVVTELGVSQPLVSHHLRALRDVGILESKRRGPFVYYRLSSPRVLDLLGILSELAAGVGDAPTPHLFRCPAWWPDVYHRGTVKEEQH